MKEYHKEHDEPDNWIDPDKTVDDKYNRHIDALAHFDDKILNAVRHLPTSLALETGEILTKAMRVNEHIVREIFCGGDNK